MIVVAVLGRDQDPDYLRAHLIEPLERLLAERGTPAPADWVLPAAPDRSCPRPPHRLSRVVVLLLDARRERLTALRTFVCTPTVETGWRAHNAPLVVLQSKTIGLSLGSAAAGERVDIIALANAVLRAASMFIAFALLSRIPYRRRL